MEQEVRVEDDEGAPAGPVEDTSARPAESTPAGPADGAAVTGVVMREPSWRPEPEGACAGGP